METTRHVIDLDNINIILDHFYDQEIADLESELGQLPQNLERAVLFVEQAERTDHIGYNLLKLKLDYQKA